LLIKQIIYLHLTIKFPLHSTDRYDRFFSISLNYSNILIDFIILLNCYIALKLLYFAIYTRSIIPNLD